ncbi:transcriptional regulator, TrmB [Cohaesibacter sp. ES.047]|uniref:MarR family winged helix-turn-helix transcriptional regulator n=1 Tax=Cohaesibacter sp. ES.047 TaxID=1798205 RepID=UPI000BB841B5|nr:MarR family winged helix-turn-helix transcriptional regulator [Cohaesibacter sp. ES.047]SNY89974.1 transcriptional regulator, TrmB [Cohaesibacter sp. ES.047]
MTASQEIRVVLKAIRKIERALDIHSRVLNKESGLTLPQLIVLRCVRDLGEPSGNAIARDVDLSPPTVLGILDKLSTKGLIERQRLQTNRRVVISRITEHGARVLAAAPSPLGETFSRRFFALEPEQRQVIIDSLEKVAEFSGVEKIEQLAEVMDLPVPSATQKPH